MNLKSLCVIQQSSAKCAILLRLAELKIIVKQSAKELHTSVIRIFPVATNLWMELKNKIFLLSRESKQVWPKNTLLVPDMYQ